MKTTTSYLLALFLTLFSLPALADVTASRDLAYGADKKQQLDVYVPDACKASSCPVVIWVHGGGWRHGGKDMRAGQKLANVWAEQGIVFVSIDYRLTPQVMHPAHVQDVAASINWVKKNIANYHGDASRVFLLGHSAGAHLVALVATDASYLGAYGIKLTDLAGVFPIDTASFDLRQSAPLVEGMVDKAFGTDQAVLIAASPLFQIKPNTAYPHFVIAAAKQRVDAQQDSNQLARKINVAQNGNVAEVIIADFPGEKQLQAHRSIAEALKDLTHPMTKRLLEVVLGR